jgi:hypothetical protein
MTYPRQLPLYDPRHKPETWNERMLPGEFAVHYSRFPTGSIDRPYCTVFNSLQEAINYAQEWVERHTDLRCAIYDDQGLVGSPIREIRGRDYKDGELSARFRRWLGSLLFFGGSFLTIFDWTKDFRLLWPSTLGTRLLMPGFTLLFVEAMIVLHQRWNRASSEDKEPA